MKKFLALVLAVLMIASTVVSVSAFTDVAEDYAYAEAIANLQEYAVVQGKTETEFAPEDLVTRLQMAIFMARANTAIVDDEEWKDGDANLFTDCTQYLGAIQYCFTKGIIKGQTATTFAPEANITLRDGVIMAVRALGYEKADDGKDADAKKYNVAGANYWLPYYQTASEIGLLENLDKVAVTKAMTRGETAQLIWNMLNTEVYAAADDYNNKYTLADVVFEGKQVVDVDNVTAAYISETPLQSIGADTIGPDEELVVLTVLDEEEGNPEIEVPFADLEEAGIDVEKIEEYFGAYIELINCRKVKNAKDEDGFNYIYKEYEYLACADKASLVDITSADVQYHKNEDRIRIDGKTHYLEDSSTVRNYLKVYVAEDVDAGWELIEGDAEEVNAALEGKFYDATLIDTDLDNYYEIALVSYYNVAAYKAARANGKATFGVMKGVEDVQYSEELTAGDVFVYTYDPFANFVDVKEVLTAAEATIKAYNHEVEDDVMTATLKIGDKAYEVVDDQNTTADNLVVKCFADVEGVEDFVEDSIAGNENLKTWTKDLLRNAVNENIGLDVEYYAYGDVLLAIGDEVEDAPTEYLLVKEWTDFELGEYITLTALVDGAETSIKVEKVYYYDTDAQGNIIAGNWDAFKIEDLSYNKLSKLLEKIFGMYSYTVDADGYYTIREYAPVIPVTSYLKADAQGDIQFRGWASSEAVNANKVRITSETLIYVVNEDDEEINVITPKGTLEIDLADADATFITDRIGFGRTSDLHADTAVSGSDIEGLDIKYGKASFLYIVTNGDYTAEDRATYKIIYVDDSIVSKDSGSAEDYNLETGDEDVTYFLHESADGEAYEVKTFNAVDEIYLDATTRRAIRDITGELHLAAGVYLLNEENIVKAYKLRDFGAGIEAVNTFDYNNDGDADFTFYSIAIKASEIVLDYNDYHKFNIASGDQGLNSLAGITEIEFRFYEDDGEKVYKVDKSNYNLIDYMEENFGDNAVEFLMVPNSPNGRGIAHDIVLDVSDPAPQQPPVVTPPAAEAAVVYYNLNYDATGVYAPDAEVTTVGAEITITTQTPARSGYTFAGWATTATATAGEYQAGAAFEVTAATHTLYAVWTVNP